METKNLFSRSIGIFKVSLIVITIILQLVLLGYSVFKFSEATRYIYWVVYFFAICLVLKIIYNDNKASYKITWITFLLVFPTAGIIFYGIFGRARFIKKITNKIDEIEEDNEYYYKQNNDVLNSVTDEAFKSNAELLFNLGRAPIYNNTNTKYLPMGEVFYEKLIKELKTAEKFIFMEYYIVADGKMHQGIMDVLIEKANAGVEVKYLFDAAGCISVLPKDFVDVCKKNNIELVPFNPLTTRFYSFMSYRDHKKITIIDGYKAFTGGINIGDEYINGYVKYGHWKDMAMYLEGDAVYGLTSFFIWTWNLATHQSLKYEDYKPIKHSVVNNDSYVIPFQDGATNNIDIAEDNYIKLINNAKKYVYISTPYLIIDEHLSSALKLAAKSGVDVRILTPHIPDKKIVFSLTRSYYSELIKSGVKVYEYTPGFVHGKVLVADGTTALVGTINFDYRSLLWNYECACLVYDKTFATEIEEDFLKTLEVSHLADKKLWSNVKPLNQLGRSILKLMSPLF